LLLLLQVKYALPGMVGSLIDLACNEDLDNMWEEWDEFVACSSSGAVRLQLYVDAAGSTHSSGESSSGGHRHLQPATPGSKSSSGSGFAAAAADAGNNKAAAAEGSWGEDAFLRSSSHTADAPVLVPVCRPLLAEPEQQQQQQVSQPWLGAHAVPAAAVEDHHTVGLLEGSASKQFATRLEMTDAAEGDPEVAVVLAALAAERAAGRQAAGEVQRSSNNQQQQQQQRRVDVELEQHVKQLQVCPCTLWCKVCWLAV
jgi:hypothetical protein